MEKKNKNNFVPHVDVPGVAETTYAKVETLVEAMKAAKNVPDVEYLQENYKGVLTKDEVAVCYKLGTIEGITAEKINKAGGIIKITQRVISEAKETAKDFQMSDEFIEKNGVKDYMSVIDVIDTMIDEREEEEKEQE